MLFNKDKCAITNWVPIALLPSVLWLLECFERGLVVAAPDAPVFPEARLADAGVLAIRGEAPGEVEGTSNRELTKARMCSHSSAAPESVVRKTKSGTHDKAGRIDRGKNRRNRTRCHLATNLQPRFWTELPFEGVASGA